MATAHRTRKLRASQHELWELIADPHHMPRWWPGVDRMEGVEDERFTQVFKTKRGRPIRADFHVLESEPPRVRAWEQDIPGTPFERVLNRSVIEMRLEPVDGGTEVTIAHLQKLRGYSRSGGLLLRGATRKKLDEALDGLERISS
jgi:uncharacterized protein YndB with AHSA1/START domain